jgi:hypothetical protein
VSRFWFRVEANGIRKGGGGERGSSYLEYRIGEELPLASIIATMSNLLDVLTRVADESFAAKGFYPNPFLDPRVKLPDGITASRLSADAKGYTIGLQHFDKPKARCAISYRMRNPFDEKASDRETVCQWHDFDPAW